MKLSVLALAGLLFTAASAQVAAPEQPATTNVPAGRVAGAQPAPMTAVYPAQQPPRVAANSPAARPSATPPVQSSGVGAVPAPSASSPAAQPVPPSAELPVQSSGVGAVSASMPSGAPAAAATHAVTVGGTSNKFFPEMTNVAVGDTVVFTFASSTHNVIQSDAKGGCTKSTNPSAFMFPQAGGLATQGTTFPYVVPATTKNIWFYCAPHCQIGMTGGLLLAGAGTAVNSTGASSESSTGTLPPVTGAPTSAACSSLVLDKVVMVAAAALAAAAF